ncbi:hypothetical protein [Nostoc sp.]
MPLLRAGTSTYSGTVFEQNIILSADDGQLLKARRVKVCLEQPNRV